MCDIVYHWQVDRIRLLTTKRMNFNTIGSLAASEIHWITGRLICFSGTLLRVSTDFWRGAMVDSTGEFNRLFR